MARNDPALAGDNAVQTTFNSFNYGLLSREEEMAVRAAATRIHMRLRRSAEDIIEIGKDLIETQKLVGNGNFLKWIGAEFSMSQRSAYNFISAAERFGDKLATIATLDATAIYELAAPTTPPEVIGAVEELLLDGQKVTVADVRALKTEAKAARADVRKLNKELADVKEADAKAMEKLASIDVAAITDQITAQVQAHAKDVYRARIADLADAVVTRDAAIAELRAENETLKGGISAPTLPPAIPITGEFDTIDSLIVAMRALRRLDTPTCEAFWNKQRSEGTAKATLKLVKNVVPRISMLAGSYRYDDAGT